ncbi:MAG: TetR/AcrR family transcriptional regulator [Alphaproteobacteria bacterium]
MKLASFILGIGMGRELEPQWRAKRRDKILASASRLFCRTAYEAVQMDDVAAAAGVGKATLYRYFPSKDQLYLEVCTEAFARLEENLRAAEHLPPAKALASMITALIDVLAEQIASLQLLSGERSPIAERWRVLYRRERRTIIEALRKVLAAGIETGEFRALDLEAAPRLLLGMVRGGLAMSEGLGRAELTTAMLDLVFKGTMMPRQVGVRLRSQTPRAKANNCRKVRVS